MAAVEGVHDVAAAILQPITNAEDATDALSIKEVTDASASVLSSQKLSPQVPESEDAVETSGVHDPDYPQSIPTYKDNASKDFAVADEGVTDISNESAQGTHTEAVMTLAESDKENAPPTEDTSDSLMNGTPQSTEDVPADISLDSPTPVVESTDTAGEVAVAETLEPEDATIIPEDSSTVKSQELEISTNLSTEEPSTAPEDVDTETSLEPQTSAVDLTAGEALSEAIPLEAQPADLAESAPEDFTSPSEEIHQPEADSSNADDSASAIAAEAPATVAEASPVEALGISDPIETEQPAAEEEISAVGVETATAEEEAASAPEAEPDLLAVEAEGPPFETSDPEVITIDAQTREFEHSDADPSAVEVEAETPLLEMAEGPDSASPATVEKDLSPAEEASALETLVELEPATGNEELEIVHADTHATEVEPVTIETETLAVEENVTEPTTEPHAEASKTPALETEAVPFVIEAAIPASEASDPSDAIRPEQVVEDVAPPNAIESPPVEVGMPASEVTLPVVEAEVTQAVPEPSIVETVEPVAESEFVPADVEAPQIETPAVPSEAVSEPDTLVVEAEVPQVEVESSIIEAGQPEQALESGVAPVIEESTEPVAPAVDEETPAVESEVLVVETDVAESPSEETLDMEAAPEADTPVVVVATVTSVPEDSLVPAVEAEASPIAAEAVVPDEEPLAVSDVGSHEVEETEPDIPAPSQETVPVEPETAVDAEVPAVTSEAPATLTYEDEAQIPDDLTLKEVVTTSATETQEPEQDTPPRARDVFEEDAAEVGGSSVEKTEFEAILDYVSEPILQADTSTSEFAADALEALQPAMTPATESNGDNEVTVETETTNDTLEVEAEPTTVEADPLLAAEPPTVAAEVPVDESLLEATEETSIGTFASESAEVLEVTTEDSVESAPVDSAPEQFIEKTSEAETVPVIDPSSEVPVILDSQEPTFTVETDLEMAPDGEQGEAEVPEGVLSTTLLAANEPEPERPKSPWTPSYSVTTQGPGNAEPADDVEELEQLEQLPPTVAVEAGAEDAYVEQSTSDVAATPIPELRETDEIVQDDVVSIPPSTDGDGVVSDLSVSVSSLTLPAEESIEERPKSPWTPSYSVTTQGTPRDDADLEQLEQLPPQAIQPSDELPADDPASSIVEKHVLADIAPAPTDEPTPAVDQGQPTIDEEPIIVEEPAIAEEQMNGSSPDPDENQTEDEVPEEPLEHPQVLLQEDHGAADIHEPSVESQEESGVPSLTIPQDEQERPKSPWTPSYSVTRQGPEVPADDSALDEELAELEPLPARSVDDDAMDSIQSSLVVMEGADSRSDVAEASVVPEAPSSPQSELVDITPGLQTPLQDSSISGEPDLPVPPSLEEAPLSDVDQDQGSVALLHDIDITAQATPQPPTDVKLEPVVHEESAPETRHVPDKVTISSAVPVDGPRRSSSNETLTTEKEPGDDSPLDSPVDEAAAETGEPTSTTTDGDAKAQDFPAIVNHNGEGRQSGKKPSLSRLAVVDEDSAARDSGPAYLDVPSPITTRTRLESTASSRFFPGGWFSSSPKSPGEGRPSLDNALGEFVSKSSEEANMSTPVPPTPTQEPVDEEKKSKWCVIM